MDNEMLQYGLCGGFNVKMTNDENNRMNVALHGSDTKVACDDAAYRYDALWANKAVVGDLVDAARRFDESLYTLGLAQLEWLKADREAKRIEHYRQLAENMRRVDRGVE